MRSYQYVGPASILAGIDPTRRGHRITKPADFSAWAKENAPGATSVTVTYIVDADGDLHIADRRSEHVACAGGQVVRAAGEMTIVDLDSDHPRVEEVSNQSTGYCPEPDCWLAVQTALELAGVFQHPGGWTASFIFRICPSCGERNLVKDDWYVCALCDAPLPREWNFQSPHRSVLDT